METEYYVNKTLNAQMRGDYLDAYRWRIDFLRAKLLYKAIPEENVLRAVNTLKHLEELRDMTATIDYDELIRESDEAILLLIERGETPDEDKKAWIPKSQIVDHDEQEHTVEIPQWLAEAKGLA